MKSARLALVLVSISGAATVASAARQPDHLATSHRLEVANGPAVRAHRAVDHGVVPPTALRAWGELLTDTNARWRSMWDRSTGVPLRLFGAGVEAPGAMADASVAEAFAREFLSRHIELLAPGASAKDFELVSNVVHAGIRSVGFYQYHDGMRVLGGQVSFRFKNDRMFMVGSEALPNVKVRALAGRISVDRAIATSRDWVLKDAAAIADPGTVEGPFILPLVGADGVREYRTVLRVNVAARQPVGRWEVFVDPTTGDPVAREQTLMFATGTLLYDVPLRRPSGDRIDVPANLANISVNGDAVTTGADGLVSWEGDAAATVTVRALGPQVNVVNTGGSVNTSDLTLDPGGMAIYSAADDERIDAQIATFVHTMIVKDYARGITPNMEWLGESINATVNIDDNCNAFSDGTNINFFTSGGGCENTGRLADVVYHEFGHSYHAHSIIPGVGAFEGALSEGISDYLAATITNDPGMGRGFFFSDQPLRHIDPEVDKVYPDDLVGQVHSDGEIIGGTLWDLRKNLVASLGEEQGVTHADFLFQAGIARATDMVTMYPEILAADDDDGDLSNGTPNLCDINEAFGRHGMRSIETTVTPLGVEIPEQAGFHVSLAFEGLSEQCGNDGVETAVIEWQLREDTAVAGSVAMETADGVSFDGFIPHQAEGAVVNFRVLVTFLDGSQVSYPDNAADPMYEFFVGTVEPLYCTDFETDPEVDGWTHGLTSGEMSEGADDWMWGEPAGVAGSGDPGEAFSGTKVFGNDLGGGNFNGKYQSEKVNFALSPTIDVGDYTDVRLQYRRWLNVEDAHFDRATIYANDVAVWTNLDSNMGDNSNTHHQDSEWRFHDVPVSSQISDGKVQIKFEIASDGGLELGGWTIDDFCVVAYTASVCGDGEITGIETCDDGDGNKDQADACRTNCQAPVCGDGIVDSAEACDDGNDSNDDNCTNTCERPPGYEEGGGCGCRASDRGAPWGGLVLALGVMLALVSRRRRRV